jgi:CRISPR-associated endonuclease/helicase Cas3
MSNSLPSNVPPPFIAHYRASDAKWQLLTEHLGGVGHLTARHAQKIGMGRFGHLAGLLHDIGKFSEEFQNYLLSAVGVLNPDEDEEWVDAASLKGKVDHSTAGAQWAWHALRDKGTVARTVAQALALCVASHHSGLIDCIGASSGAFGDNLFDKRMAKARDKTHLDEVLAKAPPELLERCVALANDAALLSDMVARVSAIASARPRCAAPVHQQFGLLLRFLFSCLIDADRIDSADFENPHHADARPLGSYAEWPMLVGRIEAHLAQWSPAHPIDHLRQQISDECRAAAYRAGPGIYTLTVPTGGGKTLASLRFALHLAAERKLDRIVYVIPFTSIIDQNAEVVRAILEPSNSARKQGRIVLEHHGSLTPERQTWREKILCENWDAPVVYTTMVQFLEALFGAGTRGARRMHQLANAVLIFDEVQTLPVHCVHLFNNAINFLAEQCNSTVVLCTATQPLLHKVCEERGAARLANRHELMSDVQGLFEALKRVEVEYRPRPEGWSDAEVAELALEQVDARNSCLVVVNTKGSARRVYDHAHHSLPAEALLHLSTNMCPAHRKEELDRVRQRLKDGLPILCVSTQLIEAGVDVSFRTVIRFLAGLDSIAQAAGRCNRHGHSEPGHVYVVNPKEENLQALPDIKKGRECTLRVLDELKKAPARYPSGLIGPEALADYYRYYFHDRQAEMSYDVSAKDIGHDDSLLELLSSNCLSVHQHLKQQKTQPGLFFHQAFMTATREFKAIDAPTQGVIVPYGEAGKELVNDLLSSYDITKEIDLLRRAQQFTVNVFPNDWKKLMEQRGALTTLQGTEIYCLDGRYYSDHFGLSTAPVSPMETLYAG